MLKTLDLFLGIGGLFLGVKRGGPRTDQSILKVEAERRIGLLGNAVVPQTTQYAWNQLGSAANLFLSGGESFLKPNPETLKARRKIQGGFCLANQSFVLHAVSSWNSVILKAIAKNSCRDTDLKLFSNLPNIFRQTLEFCSRYDPQSKLCFFRLKW